MTVLLVLCSVLIVALGGLLLSQATTGVGVICIGIALAIWARLAQAAEHYRADRQTPSIPPQPSP